MILNKPVITITIVNLDSPFKEMIDSASIHVNHNKDITVAIKAALNDNKHMRNKRKKLVEELCYKIDGKATERVAKIIYKITNH